MSLLTDDEMDAIAEANPTNLALFARAIESAVLAKLAVMELPEPMYIVNVPYEGLEFADKIRYEITTESERMIVYKADQLRQAYAQGAASQLASGPSYWRYLTNGVHEHIISVCPPDDAYDEGTLTPLFTRKEPS